MSYTRLIHVHVCANPDCRESTDCTLPCRPVEPEECGSPAVYAPLACRWCRRDCP
ncbi:MAG TPA: hypothetical protein VGX21_03225 [Methylomirabilota bacterium]|jgi:hypothetical protein|nr:hypothetical protein [Methylomirabilota bacterium]